MIKGLSTETASDKCRSPNRRHSVLNGSVLQEHAECGVNDGFEKAKAAFAAEASELLCLEPIDSDLLYKRSESMRGIIVKVLLYIGTLKIDKAALIASLVERVALDDEFRVEENIKNTAEFYGVKPSTVEGLVEKTFNLYDSAVFKRIEALTKTRPFTSKDALCDIALYVRTKVYGGYRSGDK